MFTYDNPSDSPTDAVLLDFQFTFVGSPTLDLIVSKFLLKGMFINYVM